MSKKLLLSEILKEEWGLNKKPELTEEDKSLFLEKVKGFNSYGKNIYREGNLREIAEEMSKLSEIARHMILSETDEWFDKVTINRNMKSLDGISKEFQKTASEAQSVQERLTSLYEDMGLIFNRYFNVESEGGVNSNIKSNIDGLDSKDNRGGIDKGEVKKVAKAVKRRTATTTLDKEQIRKVSNAVKRRK